MSYENSELYYVPYVVSAMSILATFHVIKYLWGGGKLGI